MIYRGLNEVFGISKISEVRFERFVIIFNLLVWVKLWSFHLILGLILVKVISAIEDVWRNRYLNSVG